MARDLRSEGFIQAESSSGPTGDIDGIPGCVNEAKNEARVTLSEYIKQLQDEMRRAKVDTGFVWIRRRGFDDTDNCYVLTTGRIAKSILRRLYLDA